MNEYMHRKLIECWAFCLVKCSNKSYFWTKLFLILFTVDVNWIVQKNNDNRQKLA